MRQSISGGSFAQKSKTFAVWGKPLPERATGECYHAEINVVSIGTQDNCFWTSGCSMELDSQKLL
jgi:hypothetical protein